MIELFLHADGLVLTVQPADESQTESEGLQVENLRRQLSNGSTTRLHRPTLPAIQLQAPSLGPVGRCACPQSSGGIRVIGWCTGVLSHRVVYS